MKRRSGYTLIEAMIVLAIVTIVSMMAIPNFQKWVYHLNYNGFIRDVFTEFRHARERALATGIAHTVDVDTVNNKVRLRASDNSYVRKEEIKAPGGSDILSGSSVTFNSDGSASSNGDVRIVNLHSSADNQAIVVTLGTGRVKIQ
jgi:prepilin-type N-terminal cleavage/methylation domain-containing protein